MVCGQTPAVVVPPGPIEALASTDSPAGFGGLANNPAPAFVMPASYSNASTSVAPASPCASRTG